MARPRKIKSSKEFDRLTERYFAERDALGEPYLLTGLILALGLSSRDSLDEYGKRPEFSDSVKRAKLRIESEYEKRLAEAKPVGAIFALKNFGWKDKSEFEHTGKDGGPLEVVNMQAEIRRELLEMKKDERPTK